MASLPEFRFISRAYCDGVDADGDDLWEDVDVLQQLVSNDHGHKTWEDVPHVEDFNPRKG